MSITAKLPVMTAGAANYVIIDCDGGSDDAWALLLLLKAEAEKRIELLGVTVCGNGNTKLVNASRNILRILKACGRDEIPVFHGASESLIPAKNTDGLNLFHGKDGFGDILETDDIDAGDMIEGVHAVAVIHQFVCENPKKVTLIALGPLTNVALCYSMYGKEFAENLRELYIMGGNHQGVGNASRCAEFNFFMDPEAAHIVLTKSICPITILPWEACMEDRFFVCINWRLDDFGVKAAANSKAIAILNDVERAQWTPSGFKTWNPCDAMLVAVFLFGEHIIRKESKWHATVDLGGSHTRGQMVLDHLHDTVNNPKNVRIIEIVDADVFKMIAQWTANCSPSQPKADFLNGFPVQN